MEFGHPLIVDAALDYTAMSSTLNTLMKTHRFMAAGKYVEFTEVQIYPNGNNTLVLQVKFEGDAKGWIYLTGTPAYDAVRQIARSPA